MERRRENCKSKIKSREKEFFHPRETQNEDHKIYLHKYLMRLRGKWLDENVNLKLKKDRINRREGSKYNKKSVNRWDTNNTK